MILHSQPAGQQLTVDDLRVLTKELNDVRAKWYNIGVQLGVSVGTLKAIEKQYLNDPTDCLRETLTTLLISSTPTWTNIVDALSVVGEVRLAADLEQKYCLTQDIAATHQHPSPVSAIPPAQPHTWTTPAPTVPLTQLPVFASPYSVPPQPHPSHHPPWSVPHYYPPPTSYPVSIPSLPLPPAGEASTDTSLSAYSQLPQVPPDPPPSVPPTPVPVHPANLPSDAIQTIQPDVAAGM